MTEDIQTAQIQILSTSSQVLYQSNVMVQSYEFLSLDVVQSFPPAMYLLSIEFDNGEKVLQKFVKSKN